MTTRRKREEEEEEEEENKNIKWGMLCGIRGLRVACCVFASRGQTKNDIDEETGPPQIQPVSDSSKPKAPLGLIFVGPCPR